MKPIAPDDAPACRVAKIARRRIEKALRTLNKKRILDKDVHAARRSLKKARATLRLIRPGLKDSQYRRANAALRDAARPLSAVRDSKVLSHTLNDLIATYKAAARALPLDGLKRAAQRQHARARHEVIDDPKVLAHSRRLLRSWRTRMQKWKLCERDWALIGGGLKEVYARGRSALARSRECPTPAAFHEWRKQVKYLRYGLEVLTPIWPEMLGKLVDQTHALSDYLGDSHDLTVLRETAIANGHSFEDPVTLDTLLGMIADRQKKLQAQAILLGVRLFEEKPHVFSARFGKYWRDWRKSPLLSPPRPFAV